MSGPYALGISYPQDVPLDMPSVEDLSDCESNYSEDLSSVSVTQPLRAFFLGCRQSLLLTPRDLEEGRRDDDQEWEDSDRAWQDSRNYYNLSSTTLAPGDERPDPRPIRMKSLRNPLPPPSPPPPARSTRSAARSVRSAARSVRSAARPTAPHDPNHGLGNAPLPAKRGVRFYRYLRWNIGSVYRRIFGLAFLGNITAFLILLIQNFAGGERLTYRAASAAVSANILASVVVRNEHLVNALFLVFGTWPKHFPLSFRRLCAKVYSYGGIHSGCGVAATFWYIAFLVLISRDFLSRDLSVLRGYALLVSYGVILLLSSILFFAHPRMRAAMHNWFEGVHRFMGWTVILLFWAQVTLLAADSPAPFGVALVSNPSFWMLLGATLLIVYPWTRLRLRNVEAEVLSDHCVRLNFDYANVQYGQAVRLSDAPLKETHSFAVIPKPPKPSAPKPTCHGCGRPISSRAARCAAASQGGNAEQALCRPDRDGFSVLVSNAGDWTQKMIRNPPKKLYTRGAPQYGVLRVAGLFRPCIVMATGSGIGPCLSLFVQQPDHPVRIIWSAPNPVQTYGQDVIDLLYRTDPRAVIIDTRKSGRPDLVGIAYRMWESSRWEGDEHRFGLDQPYFPPPPGSIPPPRPSSDPPTPAPAEAKKKSSGPCEAVVIISNQRVTKKVVYGLESRGVPAFGAIFDS